MAHIGQCSLTLTGLFCVVHLAGCNHVSIDARTDDMSSFDMLYSLVTPNSDT